MKILLLVGLTILTWVKLVKSQTGVLWNKRTKSFESIFGLITTEAERRKILLETRQRENHNFNSQPLNLTYYEELGFFQYRDNNTKVSGICGDMWTILSEFLNFTLVLSKSEKPSLGVTNKDGTYTGILEYCRLNQTDVVPKMSVYITRFDAVEFAPALWMRSLRIFAHGQWKRNRTWMLNLLATNVWTTIVIFLIILSLASVLTQKILARYGKRSLEPESFFSHFFYNFATMCNQPGSSCNRTGSGSKMLNLTIGVFAFLTLVAYNSRLIYSMTEESFEAPFNDLESLLDNTKFQIIVFEGSDAHISIESSHTLPIFNRIKKSNRFTVLTKIDAIYDKVCNYPNKYVLFDGEDSVAVRGTRGCQVVPVGDHYYLTPIASGISRRVIYRKSLYVGLMKLREYGLLDAVKKRYMKTTNRNLVMRQTEGLAIDMDRVSMIFGVLCLGIIASIIIFVIENIIFTIKQRKIIRHDVKRIPGCGKPLLADSILRFRSRKS